MCVCVLGVGVGMGWGIRVGSNCKNLTENFHLFGYAPPQKDLGRWIKWELHGQHHTHEIIHDFI